MTERDTHRDTDPALAALGRDVTAQCAARLARVAGTHGLCLDGFDLPALNVAGIGCWTNLLPAGSAGAFRGAVAAEIAGLPFEDDAFGAVVLRFAPGFADLAAVARELARVLAPHGTLLLADVHPHSAWPGGSTPARWARALRSAGLEVAPIARCGAPWPRARGAAGVPKWLVRGVGGAWLLEARRRTFAATPLRSAVAKRRAVEHNTLLPGAHRQCA